MDWVAAYLQFRSFGQAIGRQLSEPFPLANADVGEVDHGL